MEPTEKPPRSALEAYLAYQNRNSVRHPVESGPYCCPCCGFLTIAERGASDICPVCYWEDDGQDDHDADMVRGGPNGGLSLSKARQNYQRFGACEEAMLENVRPPIVEEVPPRPA